MTTRQQRDILRALKLRERLADAVERRALGEPSPLLPKRVLERRPRHNSADAAKREG